MIKGCRNAPPKWGKNWALFTFKESIRKVEVEVEKVRSRSRKSRNCSKSRIWVDNVELLQKVGRFPVWKREGGKVLKM